MHVESMGILIILMSRFAPSHMPPPPYKQVIHRARCRGIYGWIQSFVKKVVLIDDGQLA